MNRETHTLPELTDTLLGRLPLFPLPNTVLFPGVVLPLHLFEPRYRALAEHCVNGARIIALGTLMPGYEAHYDERPPIHPLLTVGAIAAERRLPDGRWDIALKGLARIELIEELPPSEPYRLIRARRVRELERNDDRLAAERLRSAVVQVANRLPALWPQLSPQLVQARTPSALADIVAGTFVDKPEARLVLLAELSVGRRIEAVHDHLASVLLDLSLRERGTSDAPKEYLH
jgi:uncharacterized protein